MSNSTILSVSRVSYIILAFPRAAIEFLENPGIQLHDTMTEFNDFILELKYDDTIIGEQLVVIILLLFEILWILFTGKKYVN